MRCNGFLSFVVLTAALWQSTTVAEATPYTYTFQPGAATVLGGNTETITGSFTFDAVTNTESAVAITLSGAGPHAGLYTASSIQPSNPSILTAQDQHTQNRLAFTFEFPLQFSPDPLALVFFQSPTEFSMGGGEIDNRPSGTATSPTAPLPVPEPSTTWVLLMGVLGLILASHRPRRGRDRPLSF